MPVMEIRISEKQLKKAIKKTICEMLVGRNGLFKEALEEAIEDVAMGYAIQEGDKGKFVKEKEIAELLNR